MAQFFQQITDRVWLYPHDPNAVSIQPGVGAIITASETVLVDAGNGPPHAREIRTALRAMDAPPVAYVIYTHFHWDHTFGGQVWPDSRIVAHSECHQRLLATYGGPSWSPLRVEEESRLDPAREPGLRALMRAIGHWQEFELTLPHFTFTGSMTLLLDGLTLHLRHVGGQHAPDSITVQADDVLFIGDCYYPPPRHIRQPEDTLDFAMVEQLLGENANTYIEGHHRPRTRVEFAQLLDGR